MKGALFICILFTTRFVYGIDGHSLPLEECESFQINPSSTVLDLSSKNIPILQTKCLEGLNEVKILILSNSNIQKIESDAFRRMESLVELDLSDNLLEYLPENLFENNQMLERISLKNNKFRAVPYIAVPLAELDLSHNVISSIDLVNSLVVQKLGLSFNLLRSMSSQDMQSLRNVVIMNINNNPWDCGTEFDQVLCWSLKRTSEENPIRCLGAGGLVSYTIHRRQKLCDVLTDSDVSIKDQQQQLSDSFSLTPAVDTNNETEDKQPADHVDSLPHMSVTERQRYQYYKSTNSAVNNLVSEEDFEASDVRKWEVIAFIGWMCSVAVFAIIAFIMYAFTLSRKPSYRRIVEDNHSQNA